MPQGGKFIQQPDSLPNKSEPCECPKQISAIGWDLIDNQLQNVKALFKGDQSALKT